MSTIAILSPEELAHLFGPAPADIVTRNRDRLNRLHAVALSVYKRENLLRRSVKLLEVVETVLGGMDIYWTYTKKFQADVFLPILWKLRERGFLIFWSEAPGTVCIRLTPHTADAACASASDGDSTNRGAADV